MPRNFMLGLSAAAALAAAAPPDRPSPAGYAGVWVNVDPDPHSLTRVQIEPAGPDRIRIHAWGRCHPQDCDWGVTESQAIPDGFAWRLQDAAAKRSSRVTLEGQELVIRMVSSYLDGRPRQERTDRFRREGPEPAGGSQRTLLPDGTVVIRYADGRVKRISRTGITITYPDGREQRSLYSQVPPSFPALPADDATAQWLERHAEALLGMIRAVTDDETAVNQFLTGEQGFDVWRRIDRRSEALRFLTTP